MRRAAMLVVVAVAVVAATAYAVQPNAGSSYETGDHERNFGTRAYTLMFLAPATNSIKIILKPFVEHPDTTSLPAGASLNFIEDKVGFDGFEVINDSTTSTLAIWRP